MKILIIALLTVQIMLLGCSPSHDFEVTITQNEINSAVAKAPKEKAIAFGLVTISLDELSFKIGDPVDRIGVITQPTIKIIGLSPFPIKIKGSTNLTYNELKKAFYLSELNIDSIDMPNLPKKMEGMEYKIKNVISKYYSDEFINIPIYRFSESGSMKERVIIGSLKSIKIDDGKFKLIMNLI